MKIFAKIRFIYNLIVIVFLTAFVMIPAIFLFRKKTSSLLHYLNRLILLLIGVKIKIHGQKDESVDIFIINHQSVIDIVALEASQKTDIRWIAKKELFELPWLGQILKLTNMISVDRENKAGLIKLFKDAKETRDEMLRVMAIFPEGTRSYTQELLSFKSGARMISEKLKLKVQPIVISNSKHILNQQEHTSHSGEVHITYLETIDLSQGIYENWYENARVEMQKIINNHPIKNSLNS